MYYIIKMIYLLIFLFGLCVGSFLNVVVYREIHETGVAKEIINKRKSLWQKLRVWLPRWVFGRSFCDHCRKDISWHDNIPVVSYLFLKGKCRFCGKKIPFQYPLFELLTAVEFVWIYWLLTRLSFFGRWEGFYSFSLLAYWFLIFSVSLTISIIDIKIGIIPDVLLLPAIGISFLRLFITGQWSFLITAFLTSLFFFFLFFITRGKGLGFGDVKLGFLIGLVLGWRQRVLVAVFLAFLTGALVGVMLIILGKKERKSAIAFGPFLLGGMLIAKIWGDVIWQWYVTLLIN